MVTEATDRTSVIRVEVENNIPNSPTAVQTIGRRTLIVTSALLTQNNPGANLELAKSLLKINALEQFTLGVGTTVYPWIEVGTTIQFERYPDTGLRSVL